MSRSGAIVLGTHEPEAPRAVTGVTSAKETDVAPRLAPKAVERRDKPVSWRDRSVRRTGRSVSWTGHVVRWPADGTQRGAVVARRRRQHGSRHPEAKKKEGVSLIG